MKKSMKKLLGLCLVLAMIVTSFAACGKKDDKDNADKSGGAAQSDNGGSFDGKFLIGGSGPLTGSAASYGISVKNGAQIAIDEINKNGGVQVGDKKYELVMEFMDDEATVEGAVNSYNALMDKGMNALLGTVTSGACLGIIDQTSKDGIFQITPSGSAQDITKYDNAFRLCFTDPLQGVTMADFAVNELGHKKIAVIYNNADEYSTGMMQAFVDQVAADGGEIVSSQSFGKDAVDFTTQLTEIKATDAEIIFVPFYYKEAALITAQAKELGMSLPFIGGDGWDGVLAQTTDPSTLEGAIFLSPFLASDENPAIQAFVKSYQSQFDGATPDQFAADGYDSVYVIAEAMKQAGAIDSASLIAAMTSVKIEGLTGSISFNADGEPNKGAKFVQITNGQYTAR